MTGQRRALIVANDEYVHPGLKRLLAPSADADALNRALGDPAIGHFEVEKLRNEPAHVIQAKVADLFTEGVRDDVLLLHFSCHGLKSESGELFFAAQNTDPTRLRATALAADFVERCMRDSRSRSVILFLDCCFGGAFSRGVTVRASGDVDVLDSFRGHRLGRGRGRAVITASSAMEYAFEADALADVHQQQPSVFTGALVEGLVTGDADLDEDGLISLDELYYYVFDLVRERNPHQTPSRDIEMQGDLVIAYSRRGDLSADTAIAGPQEPPRRQSPAASIDGVGAPVSLSQGLEPDAQRAERSWPLPSGRRRRILAVIAGAAALAIAALTIFTAFHGGGGQISPLANDEMVVTDKTLTTSNLQVINTRSPLDYKPLMENGQNPTISPDGRTQILFLRNEDNGSVPYIMNADGSDQRPFIRNDSPQEKCSYSDRPAWSSSGRYVAMVCVHANSEKPYPQISIFTAGGDYVHSIGTAGIPNGFLTWVGNTSIIFVQRPENGDPESPVYLLSLWQLKNVLAEASQPLALSNSWKRGSYDLPDWSKSHGLLFQRKTNGADGAEESGYMEIWNMDPDAKPREVRPDDQPRNAFRGAAWSPLGDQVVFWWLPDAHHQKLSTARFEDLNHSSKWHTLRDDPPTSPGDEPPSGKAQPAWGTL